MFRPNCRTNVLIGFQLLHFIQLLPSALLMVDIHIKLLLLLADDHLYNNTHDQHCLCTQ